MCNKAAMSNQDGRQVQYVGTPHLFPSSSWQQMLRNADLGHLIAGSALSERIKKQQSSIFLKKEQVLHKKWEEIKSTERKRGNKMIILLKKIF